MPVIVLSLLNLALYSRFMRSSLLEVTQHRLHAHRSGERSERSARFLFKHGLKNALIPVVTIVALSLPGVVGGAIVTETIFAWPGMGRLFYQRVRQSDIALLMGYL